MTIQEACQRLGKSESTIRRWLRQGKLKATKVDGLWDIPEAAINDYLNDQSDDQMIDRLKEENSYLKERIAEMDAARERFDTLMLQMTRQVEQSQRLLEYQQEPWYRRGENDMREQNKNQYPIRPISKVVLASRLEEGFSTAYVTLVSIIQGVAFGILVSKTINVIDPPQSLDTILRPSLDTILPYSFMSFLIILLVTHEYLSYIMVIRWVPKVWDTTIPFLLGIFEIIPMFYLNKPEWWWKFTSIFCLVGILAYVNTLRGAKPETFEVEKREETYAAHRRSVKHKIAASGFCCTLCIVVARYWTYQNWIKFLPFILFVGGLVFVLIIEERYMKKLYEAYGLSR